MVVEVDPPGGALQGPVGHVQADDALQALLGEQHLQQPARAAAEVEHAARPGCPDHVKYRGQPLRLQADGLLHRILGGVGLLVSAIGIAGLILEEPGQGIPGQPLVVT